MEAEKVSREVERFIAFYIEQDVQDVDVSPSTETLIYRTALADPSLGEFLNRKVGFFMLLLLLSKQKHTSYVYMCSLYLRLAARRIPIANA